MDSRWYSHVLLSPPLGFNDADAYCSSIASGGHLASLYTEKQLDFFWLHPTRPAVPEWIGVMAYFIAHTGTVECRNVVDDPRPDISGCEDLLVGSMQNTKLSLAAARGIGRLPRTPEDLQLSAAVCERPAE